MQIQDILKKESIDIDDMRILMENIDKLSHADLVRLGLAQEVQEPAPIVKKTVTRKATGSRLKI